jgi:hypothetical protein
MGKIEVQIALRDAPIEKAQEKERAERRRNPLPRPPANRPPRQRRALVLQHLVEATSLRCVLTANLLLSKLDLLLYLDSFPGSAAFCQFGTGYPRASFASHILVRKKECGILVLLSIYRPRLASSVLLYEERAEPRAP